MAKRLTSTEKWRDSWFLSLSTPQKLAWNYLCDNCDPAGIVDLNCDLANFLVGDTLDWDAFIEAAGGRIVRLACGKLWLARFVDFQYGELSEDCAPHRAVLQILGKYSRSERVIEEYLKGCLTLKDKDKDKDRNKDRKGDARGKPSRQISAASVPIPESFETPEVRQALEEWLKYKSGRGEKYSDPAYLGRKVAEFTSPRDLIDAIHSSIGNTYKGIFPAEKKHGPQSNATRSKRYQG